MCYFTKKVLNKRFLPNRKNRWNPPVCTGERFRYVEVECGYCFECRKKKEENGESETTSNSKKHQQLYSSQELYHHRDTNTYAKNTDTFHTSRKAKIIFKGANRETTFSRCRSLRHKIISRCAGIILLTMKLS